MPDIVGLEHTKPTSLQAIADKAKAKRTHRFGNLYRELNEVLFTDSWRRLNKSAAAGVDRVKARDYKKDLQHNILAVVNRLKQKRYRTKLVKRHYIPKSNGKLRPLGLPALEDKLVQTAASRLLEAIYEQDFLPNSFGYRPMTGAKEAVKSLTFNLQYNGYGYIVEADIKGFFNHLDHDWLLTMLRQRVEDESFLALIKKWLKAGILERTGEVVEPMEGSPQGGVISPVLANIYLHYVLDLWFEKVVKRHCRGKAMFIRYCDDFVCAFQYKSDAEAFYKVLPKRLAKFNLEVATEKTRIIRFSRYHPGLEHRFSFLGFEFYWATDRSGQPRVFRRTDRTRLGAAIKSFKEWVKSHRQKKPALLLKAVSTKLKGHYNYYGIPGNYRSIRIFYDEAIKLLFKWLRRRSRKDRINGYRFHGWLNYFCVPTPKVVPLSKTRSVIL
jgi:RNA-directed DNA polymerase